MFWLCNTVNFCDEDDCEAIISWLEKNEVTAADYQTRSYVVNYRFQFRNVDNDGISSAGISSSSIQVDALIDKKNSRFQTRYGYICNSSSEKSPKTEQPCEVGQNRPFPTTTKLSGRRKKGFECLQLDQKEFQESDSNIRPSFHLSPDYFQMQADDSANNHEKVENDVTVSSILLD